MGKESADIRLRWIEKTSKFAGAGEEDIFMVLGEALRHNMKRRLLSGRLHYNSDSRHGFEIHKLRSQHLCFIIPHVMDNNHEYTQLTSPEYLPVENVYKVTTQS
jgi:hypothetical protein